MRSKTVFAVSLSLLCGNLLLAEDEKPRQRPGAGDRVEQLLKRLDKNKNGTIEKDEMPAQLWERWSKADKNGDNKLTADELKAARTGAGNRPNAGRGAEAIFKRLDKDGNGVITKEEAGRAWRTVARFDKNNDEKVTKDEAKAGAAPRPNAGGNRLEALFKRADKNGDGKVAKDEVEERVWKRSSTSTRTATMPSTKRSSPRQAKIVRVPKRTTTSPKFPLAG